VITKNSLLTDVKAKALAEAKMRGLDEYGACDLVREAEEVVEDFFAYITWTKIADGVIQSNDSVTEWHHRQLYEFENDWKYLGLDRECLRGAAERYLDRPWMQSGKLDWLVLDVLTYAEYQAFVDEVRSKTLSMEDYVALRVGTKKSFGSKFRDSLAAPLEIGVWLVVICLLLWVWPPLAGAYAVYSCWSLWKSSAAKKRRNAAKKTIDAVAQSISSTYCTFSTVSQSWSIVWDQLLKSRQDGVVWDGVVFRLVEERMSSGVKLSPPYDAHTTRTP
jgi:hypothetical protein